MPEEKFWYLLLGTVIWSCHSASSHVQLPKINDVSHPLLRDPYRVFTFTDREMIKISQTSICFYFTASEHTAPGKKSQFSIALHCLAVLWAGSLSWHREDGSLPCVQSLSHMAQPWGQLWKQFWTGHCREVKSANLDYGGDNALHNWFPHHCHI